MYDQNEPSVLRRILWYVMWLIVLAAIVWLVVWAIFFRDNHKSTPPRTTTTSQQSRSSSSDKTGSPHKGGPSSSSTNSGVTPSNNSSVPSGTPETLVNTGPGDILLVAVVVGIAGSTVHYLYQRRALARQ
jgi:cytoskeletal protein RodZ